MIRFQPRLNRSGSHTQQRGFSLIELAIVVGVTGLLFGGLWRLMASGNSQLREQTAADQMNQLVGATRNFLASTQGQTLLTGLPPNGPQALTLPGAGCSVMPINQTDYCNFLPAGFTIATTNSYGQSYTVIAVKDGTAQNSPAQSYNFLILTTGGDVIPDSSGGRLAANIGANGGFIFSNATCSTVAAMGTTACGAFGSFTLDLAATGPYGAVGATSGHIATQNSSTLSATTNSQWLARVGIPGDYGVNPFPIFNTMTVPLFMQTGGAAALNINGNPIWMNNSAAANGGGTINLQGGSITGTGLINITHTTTTPLTLDTTASVSPGVIAAQISGFNCDIYTTPGTCQPALAISGSMQISKSLSIVNNASVIGTLEAGTFIYSSDMRMKKNIVPLTGSLDKISKISGYNFSWQKDDRQDIGLIAQDVQKVYPELVHTIRGDRLGVEYGNLIAPMIEAIKELRVQNTTLQKQLNAQKEEIRLLQKHAN